MQSKSYAIPYKLMLYIYTHLYTLYAYAIYTLYTMDMKKGNCHRRFNSKMDAARKQVMSAMLGQSISGFRNGSIIPSSSIPWPNTVGLFLLGKIQTSNTCFSWPYDNFYQSILSSSFQQEVRKREDTNLSLISRLSGSCLKEAHWPFPTKSSLICFIILSWRTSEIATTSTPTLCVVVLLHAALCYMLLQAKLLLHFR